MTRPVLFLLALAGLLAGCASFSPDGGMNDVAEGVGRETGPDIGKNVVKIASAEQAQRAKEQVANLLAGPLSADLAVQVAFLNNRDLQAAYNDLGISEADYVQASLPPNPGVSLMDVAGTGLANFEPRLLGDILSLITPPPPPATAPTHFPTPRTHPLAPHLPPP